MATLPPVTPADGPPAGLPCTSVDRVAPEWIDHNGHMNVAYYIVLLDRGVDGFLSMLGLDNSSVWRHRLSTFAIDARVIYRRELKAGAPVRCFSQIFDHDERRMQVGNYLCHGEQGWVAALSEWIYVHVDLEARRPTLFRAETLSRIKEISAAHRDIPRPAALARPFGLRRAATAAG